jgi:hypothetical protein
MQEVFACFGPASKGWSSLICIAWTGVDFIALHIIVYTHAVYKREELDLFLGEFYDYWTDSQTVEPFVTYHFNFLHVINKKLQKGHLTI